MENKAEVKEGFLAKVRRWYETHHRALMIFTFIILGLAFLQIGIQTATHGEFIHKGISLKGGVTLTVPTHKEIDVDMLKAVLEPSFGDVAVRLLRSTGGEVSGVVIEADANIADSIQIDRLLDLVRTSTGLALEKGEYSLEGMGASLGASFFRETLLILIGSFILMSIVVAIAFRTFIPSVAVILAAFGDMAVTIAVLNLFGVKFSTAGIAALLMMIGYSVDTDILLTTKVLREKGGTLEDRVIRALKTGLFMTCTTLAIAICGYFLSNSDVIREIMRVIIVGSIADLMFTWFQNVGILRWYVKRKERAHHE